MKKFVALFMVVSMILGLAACSTNQSAPTEAQSATEKAEASATEEKENVSIEVWIADPDWADNWDIMEERFETQYPWIEIEPVGLGEDHVTYLTTRLSTNDLPDVIQSPRNQVMDELVERNLLADLTNYPASQYMPQSYKDAYSYDGKLVGLCQGAAFATFFYNMNVLNKAGWDKVPATWDEFIQCCKDIKEKTDAAPFATGGAYTTYSWMLFELILANTAPEADMAKYEEEFMNGTFDFGAYPEVVKKMEELQPYFMTACSTMTDDYIYPELASGNLGMSLLGNWRSNTVCPAIEEAGNVAAVSLPPFGSSDKGWISVSPEDAFCVTVDDKRTASEQEAVETFFNWVFEAENFQLIQNARGTVPVITNMTDEYIVLPEAIKPVVAQVSRAPFIKMGFNLWATEFSDAACTKIQGYISGDNTAQDAIDTMVEMLPKSYKNKK